jgi:hypothetical protein
MQAFSRPGDLSLPFISPAADAKKQPIPKRVGCLYQEYFIAD